MMCTPGARSASGMPSQIARMPSSIIRSGASPAWWVTASIVSSVPSSTVSTGSRAGSRKPQKQCSGAAVRRSMV